jgi:protein-S-isoprenylcysteine O-methyltransferase Ste14
MRDRSPIQTAALLVGLVFLLVGILGFIPGITSNYDDLKFAGHNSDAQLLGIFDTSILHNIVHLLFGVAGLALARTYDGARNYLIGGGVIYLALFLYGAIWGADEGGANWIPVNCADNVLHLVLGTGMILTGLALARDVVRRDRSTAAAV